MPTGGGPLPGNGSGGGAIPGDAGAGDSSGQRNGEGSGEAGGAEGAESEPVFGPRGGGGGEGLGKGKPGGGGDGEGGGKGSEPGFEEDMGVGMPDMRDEPTLAEETMESMEDAEGESASGGDPQGQPGGSPGGTPGGTGEAGSSGQGSGSGNGSLTPAEQVAILDARLEQGTGEFDAMILEEQTRQRSDSRDNAATRPPPEAAGQGSGGGYGRGDYGGEIASAGGGAGGGIGGPSNIPQNTAKYPPPADIPSGDDDDVVARQLREAAMREPDPAVREKLWEEYRKYKGISQ